MAVFCHFLIWIKFMPIISSLSVSDWAAPCKWTESCVWYILSIWESSVIILEECGGFSPSSRWRPLAICLKYIAIVFSCASDPKLFYIFSTFCLHSSILMVAAFTSSSSLSTSSCNSSFSDSARSTGWSCCFDWVFLLYWLSDFLRDDISYFVVLFCDSSYYFFISIGLWTTDFAPPLFLGDPFGFSFTGGGSTLSTYLGVSITISSLNFFSSIFLILGIFSHSCLFLFIFILFSNYC